MQTATSADGTRIAYERHGTGRPLVLLHGGSRPAYWRPVVPRLGDEYSVVVPHRRGVAESGDSDEYSLERGVEDVRAVLDAVGDDAALFGHSFGGLLALEAARTTPLDALVVYEPAVLVGEYRAAADLAAEMQALVDDGKRREAMRHYVREVMHGGDVDDLDSWLEEWPAWPDIVSLAENVARLNRAIERYALPDSLDVDARTLLVTGTEGPSHLRDGIRAVDEALSDATLVEIDGVGHGGPASEPDRVLPVVRRFLE